MSATPQIPDGARGRDPGLAVDWRLSEMSPRDRERMQAPMSRAIPVSTPEEQRVFEDRCFEAWMGKVDAVLVRKCGMTAADLPDICYRDLFEEGHAPGRAAADALRNARES